MVLSMRALGGRARVVVFLLAIAIGAAALPPAVAEDEHSKHHPPAAAGAPGQSQPGAMGMMEGMGRMMEGMHGPPQKELYPSLMELPDLPLEKRGEVEARAHERMKDGLRSMTGAVDDLSTAAERDDYAAMQEAAERMRQALAGFESGLAAHRAFAEGKAPRAIALQWFKREMNLLQPVPAEQPHGFFGLSWFHYFSMFVLVVFTATLATIQLARTRRARALATELAASLAPARPIGSAVGPSAAAVVPASTGGWSGPLRVARIFQEAPDVKTFRLAPMKDQELPFTFEPGQFLTVGVDVSGKRVKRSYSIASSPCCHGWCDLTVRNVAGGVVSGHLHERVKDGDVVDVDGPYGRFTFRGYEAPHVVMIAGGVGITPLMSSIRFLTDQSWPGEIDLVYATARLNGVIFREELEYLAKRHPNLHVTMVLSREPSASWTGARGHVTKEVLAAAVPEIASRRIHLCGPPPMMEAMKRALAELGVPPEQVKTELFLAPEVKPAPKAEPGTAVATCAFARSGKSAPLPADGTVLEAAEDVGVAIDYSCRQGFCGVCKTKLLSGRVTMAVADGLTPDERAAGMILACQAKADADVTVDA